MRLILALSVLAVHSGSILGFSFLDAKLAVQSFFIVSGFYMSLILNEKYTGAGSYSKFITNRWLKIFPVYMVVLVAAIIIQLLVYQSNPSHPVTNTIQSFLNYPMNTFSHVFLWLVNLLMIGQDWVMFLRLEDGGLVFTSSFGSFAPILNTSFMVLPQGWSLGVELTFYLIAPFLVRRKAWVIILIILLCLSLRIGLYANGFYFDPWTYRFFPTELALFLFGVIAYKIYFKIKDKEISNRTNLLVFIGIVGYSTVFKFVPLPIELNKWIYIMLFTSIIPVLFKWSKNLKWDKELGELSYPIYITHHTIFYLVSEIINIRFVTGLIVAVISTIVSWILIKLIINPVDVYRQKRILNVTKVSQANQTEQIKTTIA